MTNKDYALLAGKFLSDKKAKDIVIIDIQGKATFADYFVLCSGTSERFPLQWGCEAGTGAGL